MKITITNRHFKKFNINDIEIETDNVMNVGESIDIISFLNENQKHEILSYLQGLSQVDYIAKITDKTWLKYDGEVHVIFSTEFKSL